MGLRNTTESWGWPARLLHWVMVGVLVFMLGLGFYTTEILTDVDSDTLMARFGLVQIHKSWGFVAFSLALMRLVWRALNPVPHLPDDMGGAEKALARAGHLALYICMIALPVTGWLTASASPLNNPDAYPMQIKNMVFGLFELPDPIEKGSEELASALLTAHFGFALLLSVLVLGHAAAALRHHFLRRDGVLMRMIRG